MSSSAKLLAHMLFLALSAGAYASPLGAFDTASSRQGSTVPRVTVALVLLDAPSGLETATDLGSLGTIISHQSQLAPGANVFLEAWCQTPGPRGMTTAVIDMTYQTAFFDTSVAQVSLAPQWDLLSYTVSVDDEAGLVDDLGGNNLSGLGVAPQWARIGTVEFDVASTPADPVEFCSLFAGEMPNGIPLEFAILGEGTVDADDVEYGCFMVGCGVDADCDDGDACTDDTCDPDVGCLHDPIDCDDGNVCTDDTCDPGSGCVNTPVPGRECDDADACTTQDTCDDTGACIGGAPPDCDDGNVCTDDSCDPGSGCVNTPVPGRECDDADACTTQDTCDDTGACIGGAPPDCDDGNVCTDDSCDPGSGCVNTPVPGRECDDGDACTTQDTCDDTGACIGGAPPDCDDQNVCTDDSCDPESGCVNTPVPGRECDDDDACTTQDTCDDTGACIGGAPPDCDDQNVCTDDSCDPESGCVNTPVPGRECDDGDACTTQDTCDDTGACIGGAPPDCDDQNVCTDDSCDPESGCVNTPVPGRECDDDDACTTQDTCDDTGACIGGAPPDCDDQNVCTDDSCDPESGCVNTPVPGRECDDGDACTTQDTCDDTGACIGGAPPDCDDQNVCTDDTCDPESGCVNTPVPGRECDDDDACTTQDTCDDTGACIGGAPPDCDDQNVCTDDTCDPGSGCVNTPVNCDDGNPCTVDTCDPEIGCVYTPVDGHPEMIVVEIPGLTGAYDWDIQRDAEVSLGFSLFEIGCVAIQWGGWINTGTFDCFGTLQGLGGQFVATFVPESFAGASFEELDERANFTIPFDRADPVQLQSGGTFDFLLDGSADIRVSFPPYSQECSMVYSPIGMLNSVSLVIAAHRMHDFDADGNVDLDDMADFDECMVGPDGQLATGCEVFDSDRDVDVDLADFAALQVAFTGEP